MHRTTPPANYSPSKASTKVRSAVIIIIIIIIIRPNNGAKYSDQRACMSTYLSVCLSVRSHISKTTYPFSRKFLYMLPVAVASVPSNDSTTIYVLSI